MNILEFLRVKIPDLDARDIKIHASATAGSDNPLDVYLAGEFEDWQCWQKKRNFERTYVLSLIPLSENSKWLFGGIHRVIGEPERRMAHWEPTLPVWYYTLEEDARLQGYNGRAVFSFVRPGRQTYLCAENWVEGIMLSEVYPKRKSIGEFPGYKSVDIRKEILDLIVEQGIESWKTALQCVAGVYLISDRLTGQLYVGSATGEGGIWQRWVSYSQNGHGNNVLIRQLLADQPPSRAKEFSFSILEIADTHASVDQILSRESHWKQVLLTRRHGLNKN